MCTGWFVCIFARAALSFYRLNFYLRLIFQQGFTTFSVHLSTFPSLTLSLSLCVSYCVAHSTNTPICLLDRHINMHVDFDLVFRRNVCNTCESHPVFFFPFAVLYVGSIKACHSEKMVTNTTYFINK